MVSVQHEGLLLLFRNRPGLVPELLRDELGVQLPAWTQARVQSAELTEVTPATYRADLVVLLLDDRPIFALVVEVQLSRDEDKRRTWPLYLASVRSRESCPTVLVIVAPDASVARWCAEPIEMGHPDFVLRPLVIGPNAVPVILDKQAAQKDPELAVLSAMAHGHEEVGVSIAQTAMDAVQGLDEERSTLYVDLIESSLSEAVRNALEALMQQGKYEYQSEFARRYVAQGRKEGLQEGLKEGLEKGLHQGEQAALLEVLDARGLKVDEAARQRILACTEISQIKVWVRRAAIAESVSEIFEPASASGPAAR
jgi:hypothetical protein